jgi:hypothetical protein
MYKPVRKAGKPRMSARIDKSWLVFISVENDQHDRCVDLFSRPDGSFGFEEFRRDVEDGGRWTPVQFYSGVSYASSALALAAAEGCVSWLTGSVASQAGLKQRILDAKTVGASTAPHRPASR